MLLNTSMNQTNATSKFQDDAFGHALSNVFSVALGSYFIILSGLALTCNSILLYTIGKEKRLHRVTNVFVVSLVISDLLTAIFVVPQDALFLLKGNHIGGEISCGFKEIFFFFSLPASVLNLFFLTLDRCVKIVYPYHHGTLFNKNTIPVIIMIIWGYTIIVAIFPILYESQSIYVQKGKCWIELPMLYIYYFLGANFLIPMILITVMHGMMFRIARRQAAKIQNQFHQRPLDSRAGGTMTMYIINVVKNVKAAKTVALLVGVFLVCWMTFLVPAILNILCNICHPRELTWITNAINYLACFLDPLFYGMMNKKIRKKLPFRKTVHEYDSKLGHSEMSLKQKTFTCVNEKQRNSWV